MICYNCSLTRHLTLLVLNTLLQAVPVAIRFDTNVQAGAQQVQREVLPQSGAGRRGGPALLQAAGDSAVPAD